MAIQTIKLSPPPYVAGTDPLLSDEQFGVVLEGLNPDKLTEEELTEVERLLYKHSFILFPNAVMTPQGQYAINQFFDPTAAGLYGHGKAVDGAPSAKSILHPDLKNIPGTQVQLIGNGVCTDPAITQGLPLPVKLKHPDHRTFHKEVLTEEESKTKTRPYRWHIDSALYNLDTPRVTTLYGITVPNDEPNQTMVYDDGTGDELEVSLGGTAFVSGKIMFDILSPEEKSLAVRTKVQYAPHPYSWMATAKSKSNGLGMVSEGLEMSRDDLPPWEESKIKTLPMTWKNPVTGHLHFQVHPSGVQTLHIAPVPAGTPITSSTLYPAGAHITDLQEAREIVYRLQRPAISPKYVYCHAWRPNDLCLFHNRGVLHTVTGAFPEETKRCFWQCNVAASDPVVGPSEEDVRKYA